MLINLHIHQHDHLTPESLLQRQSSEYQLFRPIQAWQWMTQTRSVPDQSDWVRHDVIESWHRCLDDYRLPLGNYAMWDNYPIVNRTESLDAPSQKIETLIKQLDHTFHVFLQEAGVMMLLITADGNLIYALGEQQPLGSFMSRASARGSNSMSLS